MPPRIDTGYKTGLRAENLACWFLRCKGYRILATRYKTPLGEVDIICRRGRVLVFVEVKYRKENDIAAASIHVHNQKRVRDAAALYLQKHPAYNDGDIRFDAMIMAAGRWPRHLENAF